MFNSELTKYLLLYCPLAWYRVASCIGLVYRKPPVVDWTVPFARKFTNGEFLAVRHESFLLFLVAGLPYGGRYGKEWLYRRLTETGGERWHYLPFIPDSESITWTIDSNFPSSTLIPGLLVSYCRFPCVSLMRIISGRKRQEKRKMAKVRSHHHV